MWVARPGQGKSVWVAVCTQKSGELASSDTVTKPHSLSLCRFGGGGERGGRGWVAGLGWGRGGLW